MTVTLEHLQQEMKECMKSGDKERLAVVRMLISEIKNAVINDTKERGRARTAEECQTIIAAYHKNLSKSLAEYPADRRAPLEAELVLVARYLPQPVSPAELQGVLARLVAQSTDKQLGPLMKAAQAELKGRVDGKVLSESLKQLLAQPT